MHDDILTEMEECLSGISPELDSTQRRAMSHLAEVSVELAKEGYSLQTAPMALYLEISEALGDVNNFHPTMH
jgi:hypothetical protein